MRYSVIIPYRDTYDMLLKAVESIPDRQDIQIIIVDNSVTPMADEAVPVKSQAHVLFLTSSPVKGAGHARNVGLAGATGEYVLFLDADDWFTPTAFASFDAYAAAGNDITFFAATSINLESGEVSRRHCHIIEYEEAYLSRGAEGRLRYRFDNPICKMLSRSFIESNGLRFDEVKCANDVLFSVQAGHKAGRIAVSRDVVYVITESTTIGSLSMTHSRENEFIRFAEAIKVNRYLAGEGVRTYQRRLIPPIVHSLSWFGVGECWKYLRYAISQKANLLAGYRKQDA